MVKSWEKTFIFHRSSEEVDVRLDTFLSENQDVGLSRNKIQNLISSGAVTVCGERKKPSYQPRSGDRIKISFSPQSAISESPEKIEFDLLYEDKSILVVNKPPGLVVYPSAGHNTGTLVNGLLYKCSDLSFFGNSIRPGIVHRLDKDTSGLMVVAKTNKAHDFLSHQFKKREVTKSYLALVHGNVKTKEGTIDLPICRNPKKRKEMTVSLSKGRKSITVWKLLSLFSIGFSLLRISIHTGRTHQIRVHMAYMGYPVVGDSVYGYGKRWWNKKSLIIQEMFPLVKRQMLHAEILGFVHPDSLQYVEFTVPPPKDMNVLLQWLNNNLMA